MTQEASLFEHARSAGAIEPQEAARISLDIAGEITRIRLVDRATLPDASGAVGPENLQRAIDEARRMLRARQEGLAQAQRLVTQWEQFVAVVEQTGTSIATLKAQETQEAAAARVLCERYTLVKL